MTSEQVAERLQVHPRTVKRLLNEGQLPGQKVGKQWRVSAEALRRYIEGEAKNSNVKAKTAMLDALQKAIAFLERPDIATNKWYSLAPKKPKKEAVNRRRGKAQRDAKKT